MAFDGIIGSLEDPQGTARNYVIDQSQAEIVAAGFGLSFLKQIAYGPGIATAKARANAFNLQQVSADFSNLEDDPFSIKSALGTRVWANILFNAGSYIDENTNQAVSYQPLRIDTCLIDIGNNKNIIKTPIQGKDYTVKQYISSGDVAITIRGALVNPSGGKYPRSEMKKLIKLQSVPQALEVESWILAQQGVFNIVIENIDFPSSEGKYNEQLFVIHALSDPPLNLF